RDRNVTGVQTCALPILNLTGLAKKIGDLAKRTRDGKVGPDDLSGGTFTIANYGSTGTLFDTPIINLPEAAILGTGALVKRPVVRSEECRVVKWGAIELG